MPAPLDDDTEGLIISPAPDTLLGLDMADTRTITGDAPPLEGVVCPFCAHVRVDATGSCPKCTMEDTPTTRRSTGERIGPWFVLQRKNPTAPGLRFSVLLTLARRGHVTARSIVRGPTTGQLWRYAAQVKGLSRVFGICWHCAGGVSPDATSCPRCRSAQEIPDDPDQFLENYAALPVMREAPAIAQNERAALEDRREADRRDDRRDGDRPIPVRRELPGSREDARDRRDLSDRRTDDRPRNLAVREGGPRDDSPLPGVSSRSITLQRENDDAILSASELAAAFQLDLPGPGIVKRTSRGLWRATKVAALLALLFGGGTATAFYFKPDWYAAARESARPYYDKTQTLIARVTGKPTRRGSTLEDLSQLPPITPIQLEPIAGTNGSNESADTLNPNKIAADPNRVFKQPYPRANSVWSSTTQQGVPGIVGAEAQIDALAGQASIFLPTTRTAITPTPVLSDPSRVIDAPGPVQPTVTSPRAAEPRLDTIARQDQAARANEAASRETTPPADRPRDTARNSSRRNDVVTGDQSLDQAIATAADLRKSALDAEAKKDWQAAVLIYEQIAKLPEAAHPSDLKVRLSVARDRARSPG